MNVRIRRLQADVPLPRYESDHAAAFDFSAADDVTIAPSQVALVPTGLVIEVPDGMFLGIFARSSTPVKRGLMVANGVGVIDPDYCGPHDEIKVRGHELHGRAGHGEEGRPHRTGHLPRGAARRVGRTG